jgi:hypothetical protein
MGNEAYLLVGTGGSLEHEAEHSTPPNTEVNTWNFTTSPPFTSHFHSMMLKSRDKHIFNSYTNVIFLKCKHKK